MTDWINFDISKLDEQGLVKLIMHHNKAYWKKGMLEISDERYDELTRALEKFNPDHSLVIAINTPDVASEGKVIHSQAMLSLDKAYSFEDVDSWAKTCQRLDRDEIFLIQPKYDGISANYNNNILSTRGDGIRGENVSSKLPLIELETIDYTGPIDRPVRGEILIRDDDFKNLYSNIMREDGKKYKNSRNAVAGIMGLIDFNHIKHQHAKLTLVDYEMISYSVKYSELKKCWQELVEKIKKFPYPMDGIVIKLADEAYSEELGNTAHHPRGQIAFKFSGIRKESLLKDVEWSFGKNCLTPVAKIKPVELGGVTIKRASLHNAQNIIDKDIQIGDSVVIERAGDVIPYIISSIPGKDRKNALIDICPNCKSSLVRKGPELCCPNPNCSATRLKLLVAAVKSIGIDRLGEPTIKRMISYFKVKTLKDIFDLTSGQISEFMGNDNNKSGKNLYNEIEKAKNVTDYQVLTALNIPNVGANIAKKIMNEYTLDELRQMTDEEMENINTIGPARARALHEQLAEQSDFVNELISALNIKESKGQGGQTLPIICFTGKMPEKRSFYEALAEQNAYETTSTVNSDLSVLVALDPNAGGSKLSKAAKLGVKIIALSDWLETVKGTVVPEVKSKAPGSQPDKVQDTFL